MEESMFYTGNLFQIKASFPAPPTPRYVPLLFSACGVLPFEDADPQAKVPPPLRLLFEAARNPERRLPDQNPACRSGGCRRDLPDREVSDLSLK